MNNHPIRDLLYVLGRVITLRPLEQNYEVREERYYKGINEGILPLGDGTCNSLEDLE